MKQIITIFMMLLGLLPSQSQVEMQTTENANFQTDMIHVLDNRSLHL